MTSDPAKTWCAAFAAVVVSGVLAMAAVGYTTDCYGLFRDVDGRKIVYHSNSGSSKYLLSRRYIPANFDGLLVGSSLSATWDLSRIRVARMYNASLNGANITDERMIAENVLSGGRLKLVLFCIHPFITASHGQRVGDMGPRAHWSALGSMQLTKELGNALLASVGVSHALADESGREAFPADVVPQIAAYTHARPVVHKPLVIDEAAMAEYRRLVEAARAHGARVMAFIPPIYAAKYEKHRKDYDAYFARMSGLFRPGEIIDLNSPYEAFTRERATFYDDTHLTREAMEFFSAELAAAIHARF